MPLILGYDNNIVAWDCSLLRQTIPGQARETHIMMAVSHYEETRSGARDPADIDDGTSVEIWYAKAYELYKQERQRGPR